MSHSSKVRLTLIVAGRSYSVSHCGPGEIIVRDKCDLPPCEGTLVIEVDDDKTTHRVSFPDGVKAGVAVRSLEQTGGEP